MSTRILTTILVISSVFLLISCTFTKEQKSNKTRKELTEPPTIPIGLDAYRMWDQLPSQRMGARAYMESTYMREGGNRLADSRNFIWMGEEEDFNVTLDVIGKGVLYFKRTNHWHGSPWHYVVDGTDYVIKESGTANPENAKETIDHATFLPSEPFPEPLAFTWTRTHGADLMWVPIGFEESLQIAYSRTFYGTGYYIYKKYGTEAYLSRPITSWSPDDRPDEDVVNLLSRAGTDVAPDDIPTRKGHITLDRKRKVFARINDGPSVVRALKFTLPVEKAQDLERLRLQVTWDNRMKPSINAPLALFFGTGTLYNRSRKEYLVKGFPINVRFDYDRGQVELSCYYPMPFFESARFELLGIEPGETEIGYEIRYDSYERDPAWSSYFHATYRDFPDPTLGKDLTLLDTRGMEGEKKWSGMFVGTTYIFTHRNHLPTLEGDPRFFFDGARSPQAHGTGSEEWGGGGDYWGGRTMTLPLAGHPVGAESLEEAKNKKDQLHSAYRFLIADAMPFGNRAEIHLERGGVNITGEVNMSQEHYETVTYWYGLPAPSLVKTDEINIGNETSEEYHEYDSPEASEPQEIVSRFDGLGIDTFPEEPGKVSDLRYQGIELIPAQRKIGRYTRGQSEFSIHLKPDNYGVLLRRTFDYSFPNQKAEVYVADASDDFAPNNPDWQHVGTWYESGSNTYVFSPAAGEKGKRTYHVKTSNRRFREDEFLIPATVTRGRSALRVRVEHVPVERDLYPGTPYPKESAWSELEYQVFSYIKPNFSR